MSETPAQPVARKWEPRQINPDGDGEIFVSGADEMIPWTKLWPEHNALVDRLREVERLVYVPGLWKCAKCNCTTVSTNIHYPSGDFSANNEPQICPNNCGPMWRVTERQAGNEMVNRCDALRAQLAAAVEASGRIVNAATEYQQAVSDFGQVMDDRHTTAYRTVANRVSRAGVVLDAALAAVK